MTDDVLELENIRVVLVQPEDQPLKLCFLHVVEAMIVARLRDILCLVAESHLSLGERFAPVRLVDIS